METWPDISVITPTEGRVLLTERLLFSLDVARAQYPGKCWFIIIDSSRSDDAEQIRLACEHYRATYYTGNKSVREKRNKGIQLATGEIICFTDSDCEVHPNWLIEHAKIYQYGDEKTAGCMGVVNFTHSGSFLWKVLYRTPYMASFQQAKKADTVSWGPTANISYRLRVLRDVNGFDSHFPFKLGGDDADLGLRVSALGYQIRTNSRAVVDHAPETWTFWGVVRRAFRWGRMGYHLFIKHKQRQTLGLPKDPAIFIIFIIYYTLFSFLRGQIIYLIMPFLWMLLTIGLEALFLYLRNLNLNSLRRDWAAAQMSKIYDFGFVLQGVLHLDARVLWMTFYYGDLQADDAEEIVVSQRILIRLWAIFASLLVVGWFV